MNTPLQLTQSRTPGWLKRVGAVGLGFFFVKGLLWLAVPWLLHTLFS